MTSLKEARAKILSVEDKILTKSCWFRDSVKDLVLVVSSPRSGSSMFSEILRSTNQILTFQGAVTPFLALEDLRYPYCTKSDALSADDVAISGMLDRHLAFEVGFPSAHKFDDEVKERFIDQLHVRLLMQWPSQVIEEKSVRAAFYSTIDDLHDNFGWSRDEFKDVDMFHAIFLREIRKYYAEINPHLYDLSVDLIKRHIPGAEEVEIRPNENFLEMPPFILIKPWVRTGREIVSKQTVVMKTVGNTFRLPFWKKFFPNAKMRVLHLTRSAPASVNGMYDGWHHNGFWCARVNETLCISEYSDKYPKWGRDWWKFGLFPEWREYTSHSIVDIAMRHWLSCHDAILKWKEDENLQADAYLKLSFEELMGSAESRCEAFDKLSSWFGIELDAGLIGARDDGVRVQLATKKPVSNRWRERKELLDPVLRSGEVSQMMKRLGYSENTELW